MSDSFLIGSMDGRKARGSEILSLPGRITPNLKQIGEVARATPMGCPSSTVLPSFTLTSERRP